MTTEVEIMFCQPYDSQRGPAMARVEAWNESRLIVVNLSYADFQRFMAQCQRVNEEFIHWAAAGKLI